MSGNIYWLASYPKSGNTWTRAFIAALLKEDPDPVDINKLHTGAIASSREWVESALDFDIDELSHDEVDRLRPTAYRYLSDQYETPGYHKVHDAYTTLPTGEYLFPAEATRGALCIVRNPLDVAVSFAHHSSVSVDQSIENMGNRKFQFCKGKKRLVNQLRQHLLSWSDHVLSWLNAPDLNIRLVRYEDMRTKPVETFCATAKFLELPSEPNQVAEALEECRIEKLQAQESKMPFKERSARASSFFRKGIVGDWQNVLTDAQIERVIADHQSVMHQLGYLDDQNRPVTDFG